jgi:acyl carrier protein
MDDTAYILNTLGRLWVEGCPINWKGFYKGQERYRIPLPTYPFEKKRYWIEPLKNVQFSANEENDAESEVRPHSIENGQETTGVHPRPDITSKYEAPSNNIEEVIVDIWKEYLGIEKIGINDSFFELGGNSLLATQIVSRIRKVFQIDIPLKEIFNNPTVKSVVDKIIDIWGGFDVAEEIAAVFKEIEVLSDEEILRMQDKENSK